MESISRRRLLQSGFVAAATLSLGPTFWRDALAAPPAQTGVGPYGPLLAADANGIQLPAGFTSRVIAQSNQLVPGTAFPFPIYPDGAATFKVDDGWILVMNSEVPGGAGGASAIRFDNNANITSAYRVLGGTSTNCAGGPTPWGTWLSCEEHADGLVWECDPTGAKAAIQRPAMGAFSHEAACVDPVHQQLYLSQDLDGGGLYRFTPTIYPDLSAGLLEIACGTPQAVVWKPVPNPGGGAGNPTDKQVPDSIKFRRGEGMWFDSGFVYLATTTDETIHAYDTLTQTIDIIYRAADVTGQVVLKGVDNVVGSRSGDIFVGEDSYDGDPDAMDVCIITAEPNEVARFLKLTGNGHFAPVQSETVGIAFDPSGTRMYVGSQRFQTAGIVYEISGPFRADAPRRKRPVAPTPTPTPTPPPAPAPVPLGLDIAKKISISNLIKKGLAVAFTLDKDATVRVRITARITQKGRRKTVTLATLTRKPGRGHSLLRVKPGKAMAKLLRGRKSKLTATVEVRITTPGAATQTLKRSLSLRP